MLKMNIFGIMAGRVIALNPSFRLNLRGEVSANFLEVPVRFRPAPPDPFGLASNDEYDKKRYFNAGLLLEPRLEYLPSRTVGVALGGFAHFNKKNTVFGVFPDLPVGWRLRKGRE